MVSDRVWIFAVGYSCSSEILICEYISVQWIYSRRLKARYHVPRKTWHHLGLCHVIYGDCFVGITQHPVVHCSGVCSFEWAKHRLIEWLQTMTGIRWNGHPNITVVTACINLGQRDMEIVIVCYEENFTVFATARMFLQMLQKFHVQFLGHPTASVCKCGGTWWRSMQEMVLLVDAGEDKHGRKDSACTTDCINNSYEFTSLSRRDRTNLFDTFSATISPGVCTVV